jgi:trk system potassium uptake protein TrkA
MRILIVGGGTMGRHIAGALPEHDITLIEKNPDKCFRIKDEFENARVIEGDASKLYILKRADFDNADAVVTVANNDELNLFISLLAIKRQKKTLARVHEPEYIPLFNELGIDNIISPEHRAAMDIAKKIVWE